MGMSGGATEIWGQEGRLGDGSIARVALLYIFFLLLFPLLFPPPFLTWGCTGGSCLFFVFFDKV